MKGPAQNLCQAVMLALTVVGATGCFGLGKRSDATDPSQASSSTKAFAMQLEPQSNFTRSSGEVTQLRLKALFPAAQLTGYDYTSVNGAPIGTSPLDNTNFNPAQAKGLDTSIAAWSRPSSALALISLRNKASVLCKNYYDPNNTAQGTLFSTTGILLKGETLPQDQATLLAFAAARNVWLGVYAANSPEVTTLADLYRAEIAKGANDIEAKQALCMTALLSAQFWIGNATPEDALRRVALELGRRLPKFSEYEDFLNKKMTLRQFAAKLQTSADDQPGYLAAVKSWHRDWLGLRPVFDPDIIYQGLHNFDPRPIGAGFTQTRGAFGLSMDWGAPDSSPGGIFLDSPTYSSEYCQRYKPDGVTVNVQNFDPRTTMMVWEHRNLQASPQRFEVVGAWVLPSHINDYKALIQAYIPGFNPTISNADPPDPNADCALVSVTQDPIYTQGQYPTSLPNYYRCKGRVQKSDLSGFVATELRDLYAAPASGTVAGKSEYQGGPADEAKYAGTSTFLSKLGMTVARTFDESDRRVRRFAPTGPQDGLSIIRQWHGNSQTYVCNNVSRFLHTCAYRTPNNTWMHESTPQWNADAYPMAYGLYYETHMSAHAFDMNLFHCGPPNRAGLAALPYSSASSAFDPLETQTYPRGFNLASYDNPAAVLTLNSQSWSREYNPDYYNGYGPEGRAMRRLFKDLDNEPLNLLEYILTNNRPYTEMITAQYTRGSEELELYYRSQGHTLPFYPDSYTPSAVDAPARSAMRTIDFKTMGKLPLSWFRTAYGAYEDLPGYSVDPGTLPNQLPQEFISGNGVPPKHAAGILTMPAFLMPLAADPGNAPKMRTVASRYFTRLLCGDPSIYDPTQDGVTSMHEQFMAATKDGPPNPVASIEAQRHLDKKQACYHCHVNLDPLAQALSGNFLSYVQMNEKVAAFGELDPTGPSSYDYSSSMFGVRNGGSTSNGAFLGKPVHGVQDVANVLVHNQLWDRCVVTQTFQYVFGRPVTLSDVPLVNQLVQSFTANPMYNQLILDMIDSPAFQRRD
jgi:hypothetical protein